MPGNAQRIHPLAVRITHWTNAAAMAVMTASGWQIYNASPLFPFVFPAWLTLGGWLGGALAWHFAAMWLLAGNFAVYLGYGLLRAISGAACSRCARARSGGMRCWRCASGCHMTVRSTTPCNGCSMCLRDAASRWRSSRAWRSGSRCSSIR